MEHSPATVAFAMLIVFGAAKLLAELFEKIHQPGIIGEILAGVLVGPAVLALVTPDRILTTFSDLGVMFLLFHVGLTVRPRDLTAVGRTALWVASLGVLAPFLLGWAVMYLEGESRIESIFVAAALVATSVGVTAQILAARGLLEERASRVILAAAVIDDVLGLIVLAVVSAMTRAEVRISELVLSISMAIAFTLLVGRWGAKAISHIFPRIENRFRAGEVQFNLALITLFGLALLASYAGVAAIVGAFLAGMALSETVQDRARLLTLGVTELFTPFFLAGIGLQLDLRELVNPSTLALVAIVTIVAIVSKLLGCGLGALHMGRQDAFRVAAGMVPRGEVGMVVAQIGVRTSALSSRTYDALVVMAVFSTLIAPVMLMRAFRERRTSRV